MTEIVVLHTQVSYGHPDAVDKQLPPGQATPLAFATRGQVLSTDASDDFDATAAITERDAKRLISLGAATENKDSIEARLALSGQSADSRASGTYMTLVSPAEQERAVKANHMLQGGVTLASSKSQLAHLTTGDLKLMAQAFGAPEELRDGDDRDALLSFLTGDTDEAMSAEEIVEQTQLRDEGQVGSRDYAGAEGGAQVGTNVTGQGNNLTTGERTTRSDDSGSARARRRSRAQGSDQPTGDESSS